MIAPGLIFCMLEHLITRNVQLAAHLCAAGAAPTRGPLLCSDPLKENYPDLGCASIPVSSEMMTPKGDGRLLLPITFFHWSVLMCVKCFQLHYLVQHSH